MITEVYHGDGIVTLLGYRYGPGRADAHDDPHLVAAWDPGIVVHHDPGPVWGTWRTWRPCCPHRSPPAARAE